MPNSVAFFMSFDTSQDKNTAMNLIFFDNTDRVNLLPLVYTRPVAALRIGILTISEKWGKHLKTSFSYLTQDYLRKKFFVDWTNDNLLIDGSLLPSEALVKVVSNLTQGQVLMSSGKLLAIRTPEQLQLKEIQDYVKTSETLEFSDPVSLIDFPWDIFKKNAQELQADFDLITKGRASQTISNTNRVLGNNIFLEEGVKVECAIINTTSGPVYIGKSAEVMEGSIIRGGLGLCDHGVLKLGTKIYGATTIGPYSKVGGEVSNSVIQGYSNKGHDGFLGNSVLGEWCNLGADTNNSNLKNNYGNVKVWNYQQKNFINSGLQFCGLIMGDHSKSGINTMFNTGTVVGVNANIFGGGFPEKFIPSYTWGGMKGATTYDFDKSIEVAKVVCSRRNIELTVADESILKEIFNQSYLFRA